MYEDKELQEYRDLLKTPERFEEGFDWKTVVGAVFIGFLMMPGSMYLQRVIGTGIGPAARWVTIILFAEIAKRSYTELKQQEIFLLYYMAGAAMATPFQGLLWNQYLVQSDAARMLGVADEPTPEMVRKARRNLGLESADEPEVLAQAGMVWPIFRQARLADALGARR